MGVFFHVSSRRNRESIAQNGLDWRLMSDTPGIAGSRTPEVAGVFLCVHQSEADFFTRMNNTGGPVDVWQVDGIDFEHLLDAGSGFLFLPRPVPGASVRLIAQDIGHPTRSERQDLGPSDAYSSEMTITFDPPQQKPKDS